MKAKWFAASVILFVRLLRPRKGRIPFFENVYLVRASTFAAAKRRAVALGRAEEQGGIRWLGRNAELVFGGVRKVVTCSADPSRSGESEVARLYDGVEATYSFMSVKNAAGLRTLIRGDAVDVRYEE